MRESLYVLSQPSGDNADAELPEARLGNRFVSHVEKLLPGI